MIGLGLTIVVTDVRELGFNFGEEPEKLQPHPRNAASVQIAQS